MRALFGNVAFRRLFAGRIITNAGDSLYYIAAMWLAYDLSGSAIYTGLAGFLTLAPQALQFLTGPFVDRWDLRRLLVATQVLQGVLVLIIPFAAWKGWLSVELVLIVMPVVAMLNQFVYPAQNAALPRIVDREELVDANSAFSFAYQGVDTAFSSLGGILVALVGAVSLYLIDSVTFAMTALIFAATRIPALEDSETEESTDHVASSLSNYVENLREGIEYTRGTILVLMLIPPLVANFAVGATMATLPVFASLRGGAGTYGMLLAAITAGLLLGALGASLLKGVSVQRLMAIGFFLSGVTWLGAIYVQWLPATAMLFCLAWIPIGATNVVFMSLIQTYVPEKLLGRVTSVIISGSAVAEPLGSLLGGVAGETIGSTVVVAVTGIGFLFVTLYWVMHPVLRHLPAIEKIEPTEYGLKQV
ncbi:MFS transporter [Halococcus sediminicola]|uniref:MFS transporter n=1 Tax=Halococcus sediminicola TaxID=1264579 RepID=UPI000678D0B9|nr:MFS transporter [Halococcus sediminicola]